MIQIWTTLIGILILKVLKQVAKYSWYSGFYQAKFEAGLSKYSEIYSNQSVFKYECFI